MDEYDNQDVIVKRQREIKRFLVLFQIGFKKGKIVLADFVGATANAKLRQKNDKNGEPRVNLQVPRF